MACMGWVAFFFFTLSVCHLLVCYIYVFHGHSTGIIRQGKFQTDGVAHTCKLGLIEWAKRKPSKYHASYHFDSFSLRENVPVQNPLPLDSATHLVFHWCMRGWVYRIVHWRGVYSNPVVLVRILHSGPRHVDPWSGHLQHRGIHSYHDIVICTNRFNITAFLHKIPRVSCRCVPHTENGGRLTLALPSLPDYPSLPSIQQLVNEINSHLFSPNWTLALSRRR